MSNLKVVQIGMGPLGVKIADFIQQRNGIETVAAVDKNPELIGKSLKSLNENLSDDVIIKENLTEVLSNTQPDVVVLTTVSDMVRLTPQLEEIVKHRLPVVSTCEELSHPWETSHDLASKIDQLAKKNNVAVVGTGVNPGFLMDSLPTFLTSVCQKVDSVKVSRFQNAAYRRIPFQQKIGAGLTMDEFNKKKAEGTLRHVGLTESIQFIASSLGWKLDRTVDEISPVIAESDYSKDGTQIPKGNATGVCQIGTGYINGEPKIELVFKASIGEGESYDEILIEGFPNISSKIDGGVNGDVATCAITINAANRIIRSSPGLQTMAGIPLTSYFE